MRDKRGLTEVVHTIKDLEKDKDKFSRTARIEWQPMSDAKFAIMLNYTVGALAMVMKFTTLYIIIYFMGTAGR